MLEWSPLGSLEPDNSDTFVSSPHNVTRLSHYRVLPAIAPDGNFIEKRGFNLWKPSNAPSLNSRFEIAEDLNLFFRIVRYDARRGAPGIIRFAN
jgi:hypothetical protein